MTSLAENVISEAAQQSNAPVVQVAAAVVKTVENPTPENIIADIELAVELFNKIRAMHPSVAAFLKAVL